MRLVAALLAAGWVCSGQVVVFWQEGFPAIDTQAAPRQALEAALPSAAFRSLQELRQPKALDGAALLVLPYGSALPAEAWPQIQAYLEGGGNLLVLGGRPLLAPVWEAEGKFVPGRPQYTYSRQLGFRHIWEAPQKEFARFAWDESVAFLPAVQVRAERVFASDNGSGIGYLLDGKGNRVAAPVIKNDDLGPRGGGGREIFLSFAPAPGYWSSADGVALIAAAARYAGQGGEWLRLEMEHATVGEGENPQVLVQLRKGRRQPLGGTVRLELLAGSQTLDTVEAPCAGDTLAQAVSFNRKLGPGLYTVRATYVDGGPREVYQTGFWVRDSKLLASGAALGTDRDYFTLGGRPYLPIGTNYFTTDVYGGWFVGGGNAWVWERDFAEMERQGVTFVRTGIWDGKWEVADRISGGANERFLRGLEAYLHSAARHGVQVQFTFFAFDPQTVDRRPGQPGVLGPGSNPYTDPVAIRAERDWVSSIARRFREAPFLSWDLINEPSFSNPRRPWRTVPNGDPTETAAWNRWLEQRYGSAAELADAWGVPPEQLHFGAIPLPSADELAPSRNGRPEQLRAVDYNLFAQDAFGRWAAQMIEAIRAAGNKQLVTVGQDEGGVIDRLLNQFYGGAGVDFTVNHSWWQDDALLWDSVAAKRPDRPNLIGETGVQAADRPDGAWRWDEASAANLIERKLALGLAAGNAGALEWDWARGDEPFGMLRNDGSNKIWVEVLAGLASFAKQASPYAVSAAAPETAIVLPQSLQLSVYNRFAIEAQQKCVRALYHQARGAAYAVGEYQIELLGRPKLIILPAPWLLSQPAWEAILARVRAGAVLLVSGRFDADEHFRPRPRAQELGFAYRPALLDAREYTVALGGRELRLTYSGDKGTHLERGRLDGEATFVEQRLGAGSVLYAALPLELNDNLETIGEVYRFALERAGVAPLYTTEVKDPGILICPTRVKQGTLYVLTSESGAARAVSFRDGRSGKELKTTLEPGRAALALVREDGVVAAAYNFR